MSTLVVSKWINIVDIESWDTLHVPAIMAKVKRVRQQLAKFSRVSSGILMVEHVMWSSGDNIREGRVCMCHSVTF